MPKVKYFMNIFAYALFCASPVVAQNLQQESKQASAGSQSVAIIIERGRLRFTAPASAQELRLEVFNKAGELVYDVAADGLGYAYTATYTWGNTITVRKFDAVTGGVVWLQTLDAGTTSASFGLTADHLGNIFVSGYTSGSAIGPNAGDSAVTAGIV